MIDYIIPLFKEENVFFIEGKKNGRVPYSNAIVLDDYLIDTGVSSVRLKRVKKKFKIKKLFFSHWHDDHIRECKIFSDVPFYSHPETKPIIEDIDKLLDLYEIRGTPAEPPFKIYLSDVIDAYDIELDGTYEAGEGFTIGNDIEVRILYMPGHSIGHCIFHIPELKFAFLADIDLSKFGPWYGGTDSDITQFIDSINKVLDLDLEIVVTGHSGLFKGKKFIKNELKKYKAVFTAREKKILGELSKTKPRTLTDLLEKNIIYKRYDFLKPFLLAMEKTMLQKHIEKLLLEQKIQRNNDGYVID
jgi:glyoxylase-like metal-dependent hydrolase (beta-lactamase superfamily II)